MVFLDTLQKAVFDLFLVFYGLIHNQYLAGLADYKLRTLHGPIAGSVWKAKWMIHWQRALLKPHRGR